ncbi:MAG: ChrR family anti-sigma-E factor [Burkholderiales bacterium]|nr:ChrR family anti-sigma-E factor [Burkholderiales bacterium]
MTIRHHPEDELLLQLAAGRLDAAAAIVLAVHAEQCPRCRERVRDFEALGGVLLDALEPELLAPAALAETLARIDGAATPRPQAAAMPAVRAQLPEGLPWPRSLAGCAIGPWRLLGPGLRWSRIGAPHDAQANLFLLRVDGGRQLPMHSHRGREMTQVLYGAFDDGRGQFGPGDFDTADDAVHHQPVVLPGSTCVCLASVSGKVLFDGWLARIGGALVGM